MNDWGFLQVWDRETGSLVADLSGRHDGRVFCVGFDCTKVSMSLFVLVSALTESFVYSPSALQIVSCGEDQVSTAPFWVLIIGILMSTFLNLHRKSASGIYRTVLIPLSLNCDVDHCLFACFLFFGGGQRISMDVRIIIILVVTCFYHRVK